MKNEIAGQQEIKLFEYSVDIREYQFLHDYSLYRMFNIKPDSGTVYAICVEPVRFEKSPLQQLLSLQQNTDTSFIMTQLRTAEAQVIAWKNYEIQGAEMVGRSPIAVFRPKETRFISKPLFSRDRQFVLVQTSVLDRTNAAVEKESILIYKKQSDGWVLMDEIERVN